MFDDLSTLSTLLPLAMYFSPLRISLAVGPKGVRIDIRVGR